jgi:hypothetical protein
MRGRRKLLRISLSELFAVVCAEPSGSAATVLISIFLFQIGYFANEIRLNVILIILFYFR